MENKLQQLTEKLYAEGLSKGRADGQAALESANQQAAQIIAQAKATAADLLEKAKTAAADLDSGTRSELRLAASQMTSELRSTVERMITANLASQAVSAAWNDGTFVKEIILSAISSFNPTADQPVKVTLPQSAIEAIRAAVSEKFNAGVELTTDSRLKTPFRIGPADGGFYVSFTEADFTAMFQSYVRPEVARMLYGQ